MSQEPAGQEDKDAMRVVLPGASSPVPVEDAEHVELRRAALVDAISRAIAEVPAERQKRRLWTMSGRFALAAAVLLAVGALSTFAAVRLSNGTSTPVAGAAREGEVARIERFDTVSDRSTAEHGTAEHGAAEHGTAYRAATSVTVGEASTLVTSSSERIVATLPGSTVVKVAPRSRVILARLPATSQELILDRGIVSVDVPEAPSNGHTASLDGPGVGGTEPSRRRVRVTTPQAVVEVKGTQFDVIVGDDPNGGEVTTVKVRRGRVLVTEGARRTFVGAGESWTSAPLYGARSNASTRAPRDAGAANGDAASNLQGAEQRNAEQRSVEQRNAEQRSVEQRSAEQRSDRASEAVRAAAGRSATYGAAPSGNATVAGASHDADPASTLAEQNRLLEAAVAAEHQGNRAEATRLLQSLLARYPDSPHRASALSRLRDLDRPAP